MALTADLKVNGHSIGLTVVIERLEPLVSDTNGVYDYRAYLVAVGGHPEDVPSEVTVKFRHRYADGAIACLRRALGALTSRLHPYDMLD